MERKVVFLSLLVLIVLSISVFAVDLEMLEVSNGADTSDTFGGSDNLDDSNLAINKLQFSVSDCIGVSLLTIYNSDSELVSLEQGAFSWFTYYQTFSDPVSGKYNALVKCADGTSQSLDFCVNAPDCLNEVEDGSGESGVPDSGASDSDGSGDSDGDASGDEGSDDSSGNLDEDGSSVDESETADGLNLGLTSFNISIEDNLFSPDNLTIVEGDEIVWFNYDDIPHRVVIDDDESGLLFLNDSYSLIFDDEGTYDYHCGVHPEENGSITVLEKKEAEIFDVEIEDLEFNPELITLVVGDSVKWTNLDDDVPHQITSDDFNDSDVLLDEGAYSFEFKEEGNFSYACKIHPEMSGTVSVLGLEDYLSQKNAPKIVLPDCVANITCSTWSPCNGTLQQAKSCVDANGCIANKTEVKTCENCTESWVCTEWSSCSFGKQTRSCADEHICSTFLLKPNVEKICKEPVVSYYDEEPIETKVLPENYETEEFSEFDDFAAFKEQQISSPATSKLVWDDYKLPVIISSSLILVVIIILLLYLLIIKPKKKAASQIKNYIREQRRKGFSNKKIHDLLAETGWKEKDIEKFMEK
jgi:plastocyanin